MKLLLPNIKRFFGVIELEKNKNTQTVSIIDSYAKDKNDPEYSQLSSELNENGDVKSVFHYLDKSLLIAQIEYYNESVDTTGRFSLFYIPCCNDVFMIDLFPCCGGEGTFKIITTSDDIIKELSNNVLVEISDRSIVITRLKNLLAPIE